MGFSRLGTPVALILPVLILRLLVFGAPGSAAETNTQITAAAQLKHLTLEQLMNIDVTTVSRQAEPWFTSPSAIQVITYEDIRRSGATSLPEALRLAPNLMVAQVDSSTWAISARGFNTTVANKLLVMIDGRTVYTPLYAGVFWDVQDTLLEDIDRIEVVSGPGGTQWGANAVNGVINIITKSARESQGIYIEGGGGTQLKDFGGFRYGTQLASNLYFKIYGKYFDRDDTLLSTGADATNSWRKGQGGFRMDWEPPDGDTVTLQGDGYAGAIRQTQTTDTQVNGQNILGRWTHPLGADSDFRIQTYWDRTWRIVPNTFAEELNTYDLDIQHRFPLGQRHEIVWGGGYRLMADAVGNSTNLAFLPAARNLQLVSIFAQDEITLVPERLKATIGSKLEHNDFSGFEAEPSVRLAWTPDTQQTVWGAISRAVRSPSRIDRDFYVPGTSPYLLTGGTNFESEKLIAYELGYRVRPVTNLSLSLATYYNYYDDIRSVELVNNSYVIGNGLRGQSWGVELSGAYQPTEWWRLRAGYNYFHKDTWLKPGSTDANNGTGEGDDPEHQVSLQSSFDLPWNLELDCGFRYVDRLTTPHVDSYVTADVRLAWHPRPNLEISIVGQNLVQDRHTEFSSSSGSQEIPRSMYGKVTWKF